MAKFTSRSTQIPLETAHVPHDPDSATAWMADGNCRLHPPATFFPSDGVGVDRARKICKDCPVNEIVAQISKEIPGARVSAVQQVVRAKMQALGHLNAITAGVTGVVLVTAILTVLVTMTGSVRERTREYGVLRAVGFTPRHIAIFILGEAFSAAINNFLDTKWGTIFSLEDLAETIWVDLMGEVSIFGRPIFEDPLPVALCWAMLTLVSAAAFALFRVKVRGAEVSR